MAGSFITDDIAHIMNTSHFATAATYTPTGGSATTVNGIFDAEFKMLNPVTGGYENQAPQFSCATSSVSAAKHGEPVVIGGVTYYIRGIEPDGTGLTVLRLSKEAAHG